MVYSEELVHVDAIDIVKWLPTSKGHNVEIVAPPEGFEIPKKSKNGKEVSIEFTVLGHLLLLVYTTQRNGNDWIDCCDGDTSNKDAIAKGSIDG